MSFTMASFDQTLFRNNINISHKSVQVIFLVKVKPQTHSTQDEDHFTVYSKGKNESKVLTKDAN